MIRQKWQFTILIWGRRVRLAADLRPALAVWRLKIIFQINGVSILTRAHGCHLLQTISLGLVFARQQSSCTQFIREHRKIQFHFVFRIRLAPQRGQLAQERSTSNSRKLTNGWLVNACQPIELDMAHSYFPIVVIRCNDGGNIPNAMLAFSSLTTRIAIYDLRPAPKSFHSFHSFFSLSIFEYSFGRSCVHSHRVHEHVCRKMMNRKKAITSVSAQGSHRHHFISISVFRNFLRRNLVYFASFFRCFISFYFFILFFTLFTSPVLVRQCRLFVFRMCFCSSLRVLFFFVVVRALWFIKDRFVLRGICASL